MDSVYIITAMLPSCSPIMLISREKASQTRAKLFGGHLAKLFPVLGVAMWWRTWGYSGALHHSFLLRSEQKKLAVLKLNSHALCHNLIRRLPWHVIYTRIRSYHGKWPLTLIASNSCINDCIPVTEDVWPNCGEERASLASKLPVSSAQISVETNGEEHQNTPMDFITLPHPK